MMPSPWMLPLFVLLSILFLALAVYVYTVRDTATETAITLRVQAIRLPAFQHLMRFISFPGYPPQVFVLGALLIVVPALFGWYWIAVMQAFAAFGVGLAASVVKHLVRRPRPASEMVFVRRVLNRGGLSFPAGHAADYVARFGFIIYLLWRWVSPAWWIWLVVALPALFIALVGLSRIDSGEHWLSDVVGGYLLGGIWLILTLYVYEWGLALPISAGF